MYTTSKSGIHRAPGQPLAKNALANPQEHAQRQYQRAQEQIKLKAWDQALKELREAIQLVPDNSEYHALMAVIHLQKGMTGMATISLRQALKLDPKNETALQCKQKLAAKMVQKPQKPAGLADRLSHLFCLKK